MEFLTKPFRDQDLLDAIQQALQRDRMARNQRAEITELRGRFDSLTPREREVMGLVGCRAPQQANRRRAGHQRDHGQDSSNSPMAERYFSTKSEIFR